MAMVDVTAVEELGDLAFFDLFFRILNFFTAFRLLDVAFTANASVSSFTFKKKQQNVNDFHIMKEVAFKVQFLCEGRVSRFNNFSFQLNILFEHLLSICSVSVQTKNMHA